jgi:hypothetical protein
MAEQKDGLSRLSALMTGNRQPMSESDIAEAEEQEAQNVKLMNAVLAFVANATQGDIFDMQQLLADCCEELRGQIREMVEGDDDES